MMNKDILTEIVQKAFLECMVEVSGEGANYQMVLVGDVFEGKMPVKRQQMVYAAINDYIASGEIHAITIKAYTHAQWDKLQVS